MSPIAQVKKPQHSPLCLRFLTCTLEDIFSAILQCYFFTAPIAKAGRVVRDQGQGAKVWRIVKLLYLFWIFLDKKYYLFYL